MGVRQAARRSCSNELNDLSEISLRGGKLSLQSIPPGDMLGGKALETLRALLLGFKACCSRITLLYRFAKLHRELAVLASSS